MTSTDPNSGATIVVELTPAGRAAVAVVLVAGSRAVEVVSECFTPARARLLIEVPFDRIVLGRWNAASGEELIVCRRSAEQVEVHCHGGLAAVAAVIASLVARGCRHISWPEWLRAGVRDPIQAAAQIALAEAPTARTAAILLDQYHGALGTAICQVIDAATAANWALATERLDEVLQYRTVGAHLTTPWRVVLAGRTNVGKSSLINAMAGFERAIVSSQPGTTRDVVTTTTAIDGWPVQLADTAGLRATEDELESAGVRLAVETLQNADLVLAVHDCAGTDERPAGEPDNILQMIGHLPRSRCVRHVHNKIDLVRPSDRINVQPCADDNGNLICTSAVTGEGISELVAAIGRTLVPIAPPAGRAVPFTNEQISALDSVRACIEERNAGGVVAALHSLVPSNTT
jgi:tRNA modification GTPase